MRGMLTRTSARCDGPQENQLLRRSTINVSPDTRVITRAAPGPLTSTLKGDPAVTTTSVPALALTRVKPECWRGSANAGPAATSANAQPAKIKRMTFP